MSYSFQVQRASKAAAIAAIAEELATVVKHQPVHAADQAPVNAAAEGIIGVLPDDESQDVTCSVSGSIYNNGTNVAGVQVSISASFVTRKAAE